MAFMFPTLASAAVLAEGAGVVPEVTLPTLLESVTSVVSSFAGMINSVFLSAASNPVAIIVLGITITFAAIAAVKRLIKSFKGAR